MVQHDPGKGRKVLCYERCGKRVLDVLLALLAMPFFFLMYPFVALAVKLDSTGPVMYRQERIGKDMKPFAIFKFRTMVADAESYAAEMRKRSKGTFIQQENDPRVTRAGAKLRKWSLDETPQLFNILRGEMSWVGPRPFVRDDLEGLSEEHLRRQLVKPGLTGWAQVNGRNSLTVEERQVFDLYYVDHLGFGLDIRIAVKSIGTVSKKEGAN